MHTTSKYPALIAVTTMIFALISCSEEEFSDPLRDEPVTVTAKTEDAELETPGQRPQDSRLQAVESKPWVALDPDEVLLQSMEVNLDIDVADEQVLVLKNRDETDSPITIAVVDFDPVINSFKRSWQQTLQASNARTFSISLSDVIGDHKLELVCLGSDGSGNQTLSIFWRQRSSDGPALVYSSVCDITVEGSIEIIEKERSEAYQSGMKDGESYSIITREHAGNSDNILDLIESTYFWDFKERSFVKMKEEFIPGEKIEGDRLSRLYQGSDDDFVRFFNGPWYLSENQDTSGDTKTVIFFDSFERRLILFSGNVQEIYRWDGITRSLRNSLFFQGSNELMPFIIDEFYLRVLSTDSISVTIREIDSHSRIKTTNEIWSGTYVRLSDSSWRQLTGEGQGSFDLQQYEPVSLLGQYIADDGERILFNRPSFTIYRGDSILEGSYSMYRTSGGTFLELRRFDSSRVQAGKQLYQFEYSESSGVTEIIRTITLYPGRMSAEGFVLTGDIPKRYEQIESLESEPDQS